MMLFCGISSRHGPSKRILIDSFHEKKPVSMMSKRAFLKIWRAIENEILAKILLWKEDVDGWRR